MDDQALITRVDEVLHYLWDPIGVRGVPSCRDEYSSYVPAVIGLLKGRCSADDIAAHLLHIEQDRMGLRSPDERPKLNAQRAAAVLISWAKMLLRPRKSAHE